MISPAVLFVTALGLADAFKSQYKPGLTKPFDQNSQDQYSPLRYLGGLGPYVTRAGNGISTEVPDGCEVDQVVMLQRHGERYPDSDALKEHKAVLKKLYDAHASKPFANDLAFLNDWQYFMKNDGDAGLETASGPYAGLSDLYNKGASFAGKYGHLWDGESAVPLFVSESERVVQSARKFGEGFFGYNYTDVAQLNIISESPKAGGNALSPYFCSDTTTTSCDVGEKTDYDAVYDIVYPEFDIAAVRLNKEHNLKLTGSDVGQLLEIGSFDVSINGNSPWLDVFTREEWIAYNYRKALWFNCYWGPDSLVAKSNGMLFGNATTQLLNQGPEGSGLPLVLNFAHDSDITSVLAGLDILTPLKKLNADRITFDTRYEINDIIPMGAQLVVERLRCKAPYLTNATNVIAANASVPDSYLNSTYGYYNGSVTNVTGYYAANFTNASVVSNTTTVLKNSSSDLGKYHNGTFGTPYDNSTIVVVNGTNSSTPANSSGTTTTVVNTTHSEVYGFNATSSGRAEDSLFVRVVLNDAVVPLDFCYDGPGYSCSLKNWTSHVAKQLATYNYQDVCKPADSNVPESISFYWSYNQTTDLDEPQGFIPWQGTPVV